MAREIRKDLKVREKTGNLKINGYGRQSSENLFILFKRGKDYLLRDSLSPPPSSPLNTFGNPTSPQYLDASTNICIYSGY